MHSPFARKVFRASAVAFALLVLPTLLFLWNLPVRAANEIELVKVVDGLVTPVYVTDAGDGSGRLFVVEKGGTVRIVKNGQLVATPFLNISDRVADDGEAGLLSIAFPPNYATAGYFFVYYNHKRRHRCAGGGRPGTQRGPRHGGGAFSGDRQSGCGGRWE